MTAETALPFNVYSRHERFVDELALTPHAYRTLAELGLTMIPILHEDEDVAQWLDAAGGEHADELDAALGGEARARQECNELYEEIALLKRELANAQQAYNRTFDRMAAIETEEQPA